MDDDTLCLRLMEDEAAVAPVDPEDDQARDDGQQGKLWCALGVSREGGVEDHIVGDRGVPIIDA